MKQFAELFERLDQTNKTLEKIQLIADYLQQACDEDKLWAIALFTGRKPPRIAHTTLMRQWAARCAGLPVWLVEETWHTVGDLGETLAGIIPDTSENNRNQGTLHEMIHQIVTIQSLKDDSEKERKVTAIWKSLSRKERLVFNKLCAGSLRLGVSQGLLVKAIHHAFQIPEEVISRRIMGQWDPFTTTFKELILQPGENDNIAKPYPFYLAYPLEEETDIKNNLSGWLIEFKWDGIRAQIIQRKKELFIWSRGEELVTDRYPELHFLKDVLPDGTVLDGELLAWKENKPLSFQLLQKRIGRKTLTRSLLSEIPVIFMAYDITEWQGLDIRNKPLSERKEILYGLVSSVHSPALLYSPVMNAETWDQVLHFKSLCKGNGSEGLMLKKTNSPYETGRKKGNWWKWKLDPFTIDAVLIYAQYGHGRRAGLLTDYTFAVWNEHQLVPVAKAYSGLTNEEITELDKWIKKHTIEKFGPVRSVEPFHVFELAFEGIQQSTRHKSGVALRFPRISRWRKDKTVREANTLQDLKALLQTTGQI